MHSFRIYENVRNIIGLDRNFDLEKDLSDCSEPQIAVPQNNCQIRILERKGGSFQ